MIALPSTTSNDERLRRLLAFGNDVLDICDALGIDPILDGSLAVLAYTHDPAITVRDMDFSCSEAVFSQLKNGLATNEIACEVKDWHVLQARRDDLKVEFGATEVWMQRIAGPHETLSLGERTVRIVNRDALRELYQRGFHATEGIPSQRVKHEEIAAKLRALNGESWRPK